MKGSARLAIAMAGGRAYARDVHAEPPFAIRRAGERFLVVGSAAAPLCGDDLALTIDVDAGATALLGTVAATLVWPGPSGRGGGPPSQLATTITLGAGAHVEWRPEPTVSVAGSDHVADTRVVLGPGATCLIVEEFSLGRHAESSGRLTTGLRVVRDGVPLVHHGEAFGPDLPGAGSVSRIAAARHVLAMVIVGPPAGSPATLLDLPDVAAARLAVADDVAVILAAGPDRPAVLAVWERLVTPARSGAGT